MEYKRYKRDEKSESSTAEKGAEKLVSSNVAKILENESSDKDRETCEKTMFTPSTPIEATNPIVTCLATGCCQIANLSLATLDHQIVSKNLAIYVCWITSNDLAIEEVKLLTIKMILSDASDIMLMSSSRRQGDTCYIQYSTY